MISLPTCLSLLFQKLQSWFQLPNGYWQLGKIISTSGTESVISLSDGKVSVLFEYFLRHFYIAFGYLINFLLFSIIGFKGEI